MVEDIFPTELSNLLVCRFNQNGIYEIRVRCDKPIYINYYGEYIPIRDKFQNIIYADKKLIDFIINRTTEMSVYRYNSQIKQGFISTDKGIRIGLAGEVVVGELGEVKTIKNLNGLVIRIPHEIKNCASQILPYIYGNNEVYNTLIVSPPGCGKTTMIRDLSRLLSMDEKMYNILVVDERYEIAGAEDGCARMDIGLTADVISGGTKAFAFGGGIRALKPDIIITDEIGTKSDTISIKQAILSGVKVIATAHASGPEDLRRRNTFIDLFKDRVFDRVVVLSSRKGMGTVEAVLNSELDPLISL